jgi:phenylpropionate dioxygenase-like ring-hydroxylating dioxygenase large terminal subunit
MNCWWVAAFSAEVGQSLLGRWLLDTPVLLYRTESGQAVALEDRCPHRSAPLSRGCRKGDAVQCGYHGFTFGADGQCTVVPTMSVVPASIRVRSFPVVESKPYIWVYLGDPDALDRVPQPPALGWAQDDAFAIKTGGMQINANYMLLKENVLDLTHFGYVHASTFKITDWTRPPEVSSEGDTVTYHQSFLKSPLPPVFAEPLGIAPSTPYDRENYGSFLAPSLQVAAVDVYDPERNNRAASAGRFRVAHATTPINRTSMYYFWVVARDYGTSTDEMAALEALTKRGFAEDEAMIEAVQNMISTDPRGARAPEISVKADSAAIHARRIVGRWMARES